MSRSFGDILSKIKDNDRIGVVSAEPEIIQIEMMDLDFLLLCSDGIHGSLSNTQII